MRGAFVIQTRGLPDGYEPPTVSLDPPPPGCPHAQAEPVVLSTDETVACVCIACLDSLPANWIGQQRDRAEREAHCDHDQTWDDRRLGSRTARRHCNGCGMSWELA